MCFQRLSLELVCLHKQNMQSAGTNMKLDTERGLINRCARTFLLRALRKVQVRV